MTHFFDFKVHLVQEKRNFAGSVSVNAAIFNKTLLSLIQL